MQARRWGVCLLSTSQNYQSLAENPLRTYLIVPQYQKPAFFNLEPQLGHAA
jgi:hypothetical protein